MTIATNLVLQFNVFTDNFTEPLVPYRVTVVAVNLAGPGEQEMKDFFTREGGVFVATQVLCMAYFYQKVSVIITHNA